MTEAPARRFRQITLSESMRQGVHPGRQTPAGRTDGRRRSCVPASLERKHLRFIIYLPDNDSQLDAGGETEAKAGRLNPISRMRMQV